MPAETSTYSKYLLSSEAWNKNLLIHLLKRTMFGVKQTDLDYFASVSSVQNVIEELLQPTPFNYPPPVNDYDPFGLTIQPGQTWVHAPYQETEAEEIGRLRSFQRWSIGLLIQQDRSIREKMVLFWHNHFATQYNIGHSDFLWKHFNLLREQCLGNFRTLVKAITIDCHMLRYLNGEKNTRRAPNENYARELQELFCIGKAVNPGYTEEDVKQVARVLTGWTVDYEKGSAVFQENEHDSGDKTFSAFYGHFVIHSVAGPEAGEKELDQLIDMIFANPETPRFLCRKIYRWFAGIESDTDDKSKDVIEQMARVMTENHFEIKPVLKFLFSSAHFYGDSVMGAQIKSPLDFYIGLQRELDVQYLPESGYQINYSMWQLIIDNCETMGQVYANPPNVSGWPAYYQAPLYYKLWINTSTFPKRNEFSSTLINFGFNREGQFITADLVRFASGFSNPENPQQLIAGIIQLLYRVPVSEQSLTQLKKNTLLSGQESDHYWTEAWQAFQQEPANIVFRSQIETRLKNCLTYIVQSPEFHLM